MTTSSEIQGLPPLPKSLSGLLNSSRREYIRQNSREDTSSSSSSCSSSSDGLRRIKDQDTNSEEWDKSGGGSLYANFHRPARHKRRTPPIESQIGVLRKEMVTLRQLDMNLLCQLWSLNEAIQDFKKTRQSKQTQIDKGIKYDEFDEDSDLDEEEDEDDEDHENGFINDSEFYAEPSTYNDGEQLQLLQEHHRRLQERVRLQHLQRSTNNSSGRSRHSGSSSSYLPSTDI